MSGPYSAHTWVNGGPPAIDATMLTALEGWLTQADGTTGSSSISGSTSGTATLYQLFQGFFKIVLVQLSTFRNGGGSAQTIALPVAFTGSFFGFTTQSTSFSLVKASVTQTVQQITSFNTGADNGVTAETVIKQNWVFHGGPGFDTISFTAGFGSSGSGMILIIGN
jgi:hypothetical protein